MRPFFPSARRSRRCPPPSPRRDGFTLVELLVAMTVLVVLFGLLLGVFNAASSGWQRGESRVDAYREARAALALMARDLGQTIVPPGNAPTLVLDRHPDDGAGSATDDPNEQAHCLTLTPNTGKSALCAVSYSCRWDDAKTTWTLVRRLVNSDDLFSRFKNAKSPFSFLDAFARLPRQLSSDDDIAAYVWNLEFRVPQNLNAAAPAPAAVVPSPGSGTYGVKSPYADRLPAYVEVRFKALSSVVGARLRGSANKATWLNGGKGSSLYTSVILPNSQQFVQRVPLGNAPVPLPASTP